VHKVKIMEYAKRTCIHDDEFIYLYVGLGVDCTESKEERMNLVETIKGCKKMSRSIRSIIQCQINASIRQNRK
jgi:hypothetical protein